MYREKNKYIEVKLE